MENTLNMELAQTKVHAWHSQLAQDDISISASVTVRYTVCM